MTSRPFLLGAVPGATPGKWIGIWKERMPRVALELMPISVSEQRRRLEAGDVHAALVRQPLSRDGLHLIPLYDEVPVVVMSTESHLSVADELTFGDLAGETVFTPSDDVLGVEISGTVAATLDGSLDTAEAIATAASGAGIVIVPMSLARLHHRRDATFRPLIDGPVSSVGLAWPLDPPDDEIETHIQTFIGIVRGRSARSSRR
ncbi:LysR substrate-binding domain-containing protein [Microbacterium sp. ET2]|uniref:LysR substrate-binding domain-containing protein n=1 Tax=Microbacterium albipurpureum TaxID=3050384 RepID=UPI00259CB9A8|nr:LysR substrate-binding domain-containing protein [Microbacterium sp. ET2 (Ac-2212)]WJL96830.1 LysR substrate-binding domain-containing protein [Microbacterium sp. ET2 (Ac-2212)]